MKHDSMSECIVSDPRIVTKQYNITEIEAVVIMMNRTEIGISSVDLT